MQTICCSVAVSLKTEEKNNTVEESLNNFKIPALNKLPYTEDGLNFSVDECPVPDDLRVREGQTEQHAKAKQA